MSDNNPKKESPVSSEWSYFVRFRILRREEREEGGLVLTSLTPISDQTQMTSVKEALSRAIRAEQGRPIFTRDIEVLDISFLASPNMRQLNMFAQAQLLKAQNHLEEIKLSTSGKDELFRQVSQVMSKLGKEMFTKEEAYDLLYSAWEDAKSETSQD